jgi:competence protein ComEA
MFKKLLMGLAVFIFMMSSAFAAVEVNTADQSALDGVRGIGPKLSRTILDERKKGGNFKDWSDFEKRVSGIGAKSSDKLSQAGLLVNGLAKPKAPVSSEPANQPKSK